MPTIQIGGSAKTSIPKSQKVNFPDTQIADNADSPKLGRPRTGKRSDLVQTRLFNEEDKREFSDLVQSLLEGWLQAGHKHKSLTK